MRGMAELFERQISGRTKIKTNLNLVGEPTGDLSTIKKILSNVLPIQDANAKEMDRLFNVYFNDESSWTKIKSQRSDINNTITVPNAWAITRTLTGYCFGQPIKYLSRKSDPQKQGLVETFSSWLDYRANHDATVMAGTTASICGLGYKLALYEEDEVSFKINNEVIYPQNAFIVYSNSAIPEKLMAVYISDYYNEEGKTSGKSYSVWTKWHKFMLIKEGSGFKALPMMFNGKPTFAYPRSTDKKQRKLPLVEVENNAFRKGDWEVAIDLLKLKNALVSNRADDIQQVVDYILVLMNCKFETEDERTDAIQSRILELDVKDPQNKPSIEILKNALDQNGVQIYADYIDLLIQECVGIPNRQERAGGGGDTGKAVLHRNGFRDLENNAGIKIPKMDKAELEFLDVCLEYCSIYGNDLKDLKAYDVRNKFLPSLNDDIVSSSQAYWNFRKGGMEDTQALIASKSVTDASETAKNNKDAYNRQELLFQQTEMAKKLVPNNGEEPLLT